MHCLFNIVLKKLNLPIHVCLNFLSFCFNSVGLESHSALTQLMGSKTTHVLSRHGTIKILNNLVNPRIKTESLTSLLISPYINLIHEEKKQNKNVMKVYL
jgi:hypothetical protein